MSDAELRAQLRSGLGNADKDADGLREKAYQVYINEVTPNGNSRMDNITTCAGPNEGHQRHIATQVDMAFQAGWSAADRIEALTAERDALKQIAADHVLQELEQAARADKAEAKLAKAVEALRFVVSAKGLTDPTEYGYEAIKQARAALAEIEGEKT
jgi:hypothetical protein